MEIPFEIPSEPSEDVDRLGVGALRGVRVLVVDDLKDVREILAAMLTELGMRPDTEDSGEAGLDAVKRADDDGDPYQALIVDWKMPGLNGIETALRMKTLSLNHRPKFLMATAYGEDFPDEEALTAGVSKVLIKPLTPKDLSRTLLEILELGTPLGPFAEERAQQETLQASHGESPLAKPLAPGQITEILDHLDALLADYSTSANDLFDKSRDLLTATLGPVAQKIRQQIHDFDYDEARNTMREARKDDSVKREAERGKRVSVID
jgi:CheY-like chemotaxis protein